MIQNIVYKKAVNYSFNWSYNVSQTQILWWLCLIAAAATYK